MQPLGSFATYFLPPTSRRTFYDEEIDRPPLSPPQPLGELILVVEFPM